FESAVLIDFGVARLKRHLDQIDPSQNVTGGTIGYMPVGHPQHGATHKSDVFATAVTLFEAFSGKKPWTLSKAEELSPLNRSGNFFYEKAMVDRSPERLPPHVALPWQGNWNDFFKKTLGHGAPNKILNASKALERLRKIVITPTWVL